MSGLETAFPIAKSGVACNMLAGVWMNMRAGSELVSQALFLLCSGNYFCHWLKYF